MFASRIDVPESGLYMGTVISSSRVSLRESESEKKVNKRNNTFMIDGDLIYKANDSLLYTLRNQESVGTRLGLRLGKRLVFILCSTQLNVSLN